MNLINQYFDIFPSLITIKRIWPFEAQNHSYNFLETSRRIKRMTQSHSKIFIKNIKYIYVCVCIHSVYNYIYIIIT